MRTNNPIESTRRPRLVLRTAARPLFYAKHLNTDKYHSTSGLNTAIYGNFSMRTQSFIKERHTL